MDVLHACLVAGCMILLIVLVRALALHKLPKRLFGALWGLAALRLLLPWRIPSPLSVWNIVPAAPDGGRLPFGGAAPAAGFAEPIATQQALEASAGQNGAAGLPGWAPVALWLAGALACAAVFAVAYARSRAKFAAGLPAACPAAEDWLAAHPLRRPVRVRVSDQIRSPLTYSVLRPVILLPKTMDLRDEARLRPVLAHEWVHIRRWDAAQKLVLAAVVCLYWFHPLVWVMFVLAGRDMELACDEGAVKLLGADQKPVYAAALLDMEAAKGGLVALHSHFSKYAMEERIGSIMKYRDTTVAAIITSVILVCAIAIGFGTSAMAATAAGRAVDTAQVVSGAENAVETTAETGGDKSAGEDAAAADAGAYVEVTEDAGDKLVYARDYTASGLLSVGAYAAQSTPAEMSGTTIVAEDAAYVAGTATPYIDAAFQAVIDEWANFGVTYDPERQRVFYKDELVRFFADNRAERGGKWRFSGSVFDMSDGEYYLETERDKNGKLVAIHEITAADADKIASWR